MYWQVRIHNLGKVMHLGYYKNIWDAICARKAAENQVCDAMKIRRQKALEYELRPCPFCDKTISNISKRGNKLKRGHYAQRATCGDLPCVRAAMGVKNKPPKIRLKIKTPMDRFLYKNKRWVV